MDSERISLEDQGSYDDLFRKELLPDGFAGLTRLKSLKIWNCETEECLANAPATIVFPVLEELDFDGLFFLRQICRGPVPEGSFGKLTSIEISNCYRLEYLFPLQIVGCLTQLKRLTIQRCAKMKEVIWKEQGDTHIATNGIEFRNLEFLHLERLTKLVGFCTGIDQIDFPKLRCMHLEDFSKRLFDIKSSLSSNSEQNFDVGKQIFDSRNASSIFPQKVTFPCLEDLILQGLHYSELQISPFLTVKKLVVNFCYNLRYVFNSSMARHLVHLKELNISNCSKMDAVVDWEEEIEDGQERKVDTTLFPQLTSVEIRDCNNLENLFHLGCLTQLERLTIQRCAKMQEVIWKEQGDAHIATNGIEFRNLEFLDLQYLPSLVGFCTGIDQIDFPKLKCMCLINFDVGSLSLIPQKVTFPCLEDLILQGLHNWGDKYFSELLISSFPTLKKLEVNFFHGLRYVFHSSLAGHLVHLKELNIYHCSEMEAVVEWEEEIGDGQERKVDTTLFPQLRKLQLNGLINLRRFCHFTHILELPMLSELNIRHCPRMEEFSLGHVSTPNLSSSGISWNGDRNPDMSWNGDLNNALRLLQESDKAKREMEMEMEMERRRMKRYAIDEEKQLGGSDDDIHDEDDFKKGRKVADQMEVDSYDYERNNDMITWRETLPPNPQRGRCICFRTADLYTDTSVITRFYSVPFDFFGDGGDDDASSSNPDVEGLEPFYKCTDFATTSTLSSVGSSLFVVGGSKETGPCRVSITTEKMYRFDTTALENVWYWYELSMCTPRAFPITVAMDGKLYIFGGSDPESPDAPLAELFDPESSTSVPLPLPSGFPINAWRHLVVAALQPSKKILVASGLSSDAYEYNVVDQGWEKLDYEVDFSSVQGQAAVVQNGNALCWCSNNVDEVHAYHLVHKRWFKSPIKGLDKVGMRDPDGPAHYCPIFPLDDNHLCLLWKDHMGYDGTNLPLLHCVKIQVSIDPERSRFDAVVVASRTYALGPDESIFDAHVFANIERGVNQGRTQDSPSAGSSL